MKTLQHTPRLSRKEKGIFDKLLSLTTNDLIYHYIVPDNLTLTQLRIALRSMRRGTPTFLDHEIITKFIDHLFAVGRLSKADDRRLIDALFLVQRPINRAAVTSENTGSSGDATIEKPETSGTIGQQ